MLNLLLLIKLVFLKQNHYLQFSQAIKYLRTIAFLIKIYKNPLKLRILIVELTRRQKLIVFFKIRNRLKMHLDFRIIINLDLKQQIRIYHLKIHSKAFLLNLQVKIRFQI